jgi:hypothetical protein
LESQRKREGKIKSKLENIMLNKNNFSILF